MEIRRMLPDDVEQVAKIEHETFSVPWSYNALLEACTEENNIYLVCVENEKVLGYCGMWTVLGEGNITNVAVELTARNKGVATALMQEMEQLGITTKDINVFFLEVRKSNDAAIHVYEKCGFRRIGLRKNFYEKPREHAIVMSKIIKDIK